MATQTFCAALLGCDSASSVCAREIKAHDVTPRGSLPWRRSSAVSPRAPKTKLIHLIFTKASVRGLHESAAQKCIIPLQHTADKS